MPKINRVIRCFLTVLLLVSTLGMTVLAEETPYLGYEYNRYDESVAAPLAYTPETVMDGVSLGITLKAPNDMIRIGDSLFVLDGGQSAIVEIDLTKYKVKNVYKNFKDENGEEILFENAMGIAIGPDNNFYIADTAGERILVIGKNKKLVRTVLCPESVRPSEDTPFSVTKLLVDNNNGDIYAIAESINTGILKFNKSGEFVSYFGINTVTQTSEVLYNFFFNRFLTKEQRAQRSQTSPTNFYNMTFDNDGFIYTIKSEALDNGSEELVKCLNYKGVGTDVTFYIGEDDVDVLSDFDKTRLSLSDVVVDDVGFIHFLDQGRGKIYQYDPEGMFVSVTGAPGSQIGTFKEACAIEYYKDKILVLDLQKQSIQIFVPTEYGYAIRNAFTVSKGNDLDARLEAWQDVLHYSSNSTLAYRGIGQVYDEMGMYKEAMEQFKFAGLSGLYSKSWELYRKTWMADNILWLILGAAVVIATIVVVVRILKKKLVAVEGTAFSSLERKYTFPIYTALHPIDGFEQFKTRKINSYLVATIIVVSLFIARTLSFLYSGFAFNANRVTDYNLFIMFAATFGIFILFVVSNWLTSTFLEGKGTFKDIYTSVAYSLLPYIISVFVNFGLSHLLAQREDTFMVVISAVGIIWTVLIFFSAILAIHQYSFLKTLVSIFFSIIAMVIIAFLLVLMFTLMQQVWTFAMSIFDELRIRY